MTCEGCGRGGATAELWYPDVLASRPVALHESRACAEAARARLGGRPYLAAADGLLLRGAHDCATDLRERAIGGSGR